MAREEHVRKIILAGGCCLAFGGAFANVGVVLETGVSVSHLTGDISRLSMNLFLAGGICSGLMFFRLPFDVVTFAGCAYVAAGVAWSVVKRMWLA